MRLENLLPLLAGADAMIASVEKAHARGACQNQVAGRGPDGCRL